MKRINLNEILLISALLGLGINIPIAQGDSNNKGFVEKQFAAFNDVQVNSDNIVKNFDKESLVDRGDFYYLNTGKRAYFLREKNVFIIIHHDRRVVPLMSPEEIQGRFGDRLDIIKDHPLHKFVKFRVKQGEDPQDIISSLLLADPTISFISPSLRSSDRGGELAVSPHIIVSIDDSINPDYAIAELQSYNLSLISGLAFSDNEYEMHIDEPITDTGRIFELTRSVAELPYVTWAEPNFIVSTEKQFIPDDPLFDDQWHLHNTGQNGAAVDADIDAPEGWDISQGVDAVIAIYDGGIDLSHEDLNIWSNQGETGGGKETNGIDDDGNGYIDDYQGWDFTDNDNDPSPVDEPGPFGFKDNHGTAVAGVAGAIGNNNKGVSGSAPGAVILPVRMNSGYCSTFADAMRYAGKHADVVNNSWSIDACESNLNSAISDVVNGTIAGSRRGTKGTPVLFASGNDASGWIKSTLTGFSVGTYTFRWRYSKDANTSAGYDTVWVDDIRWPGGGITDFESETVGNIPTGFTSGGSATWTVVSDGIHARGASGKSVKAGTITHSQETYLEITMAVGAGDLTFWAWVSSEQDYDFFDFYVDGTRYFHYTPGQYGHFNDVGYPASNPDTIAVGASNDGGISGAEERSYYSQFGNALDVVAPSSGGGQGITTTDRTGTKGYDKSDYYSSFGGTSSATPLAAGIAAGIITLNPALTADEVRSVLRGGADKIGPYTYPGGRNDYYGYGRVNLYNSLLNPFPACTDNDDDGYGNPGNASCREGAETDCNDSDDTIYPGAQELCDNKDNDCNSGTADGSGESWYGTACDGPDSDLCEEGTYECTGGAQICSDSTGDNLEICDGADNDCDGSIDEGYDVDNDTYTVCNGDCDDNNPSINPETYWYQDSDGDSYGNLSVPLQQCIQPEGYVSDSSDCDDSDPDIYPGGPAVRITGVSPAYYSTLQAAYDTAVEGAIIQSKAKVLEEDLDINLNKTVTLEGGYNCDYTIATGKTTINGTLTISNGQFFIGNIAVE